MLIKFTYVFAKKTSISLRFNWFVFAISIAAVSAHSQAISKFEFGTGKATHGYSAVQPADIYSIEKGYGFEPGSNVTCSANGGKTAAGLCSANTPFYFSVS